MANIKVKFKEAYQDFGAYALLKNVTDKGVLIVDGTEVLNSIADLPTVNSVDSTDRTVVIQNGQVVTTSISNIGSTTVNTTALSLINAINAQTVIADPGTISDIALIPSNLGSIPFVFLKYLIGGQSDNNNTYNGTATNTLNISSQFANNIFNNDVLQNVNCELEGNEFTGRFELSVGAFLYYNTFATKVSKLLMTTITYTDVVGNVDRLISCEFLRTSTNRNFFGGRLEWCSSLLITDVTIDNDFVGNNLFSIKDLTCNCKFENINGKTNHGSSYGFDNCTITGTTSSSIFGNFNLECKIVGKTITEASYPELFDNSFIKTIFAKPNGSIWYHWFDDSNVIQFTEIV